MNTKWINEVDTDAVFILMMIVGVLGVVFAYPREIMGFFVYSINVIAITNIIQIVMIAIGFGGFICFMINRILNREHEE